MHRRRLVYAVLAGLLLTPVLGTGGTAAGQSSTGQSPAGRADCKVADDAALRARSVQTPDGHRSHERWVADDPGQQVVRKLWTVLGGQFGATTKTQTTARLQRGLIGTALDHTTQTFVVVVDPARVDATALQRRLDSARRLPGQVGSPALLGPAVRVQQGCSTAAGLLEADGVLARGDWHPGARRAGYSSYLDPADSTYHVTVHHTAPDVAKALQERLGARVTVKLGVVSDLSRVVDGEPHYGGSALGRNRSWSHCTAGFTVRIRRNGQLGSTTAGHCFNNQDGIWSGNPVANRWEYFGFGAGKDRYPAYDMMRIESTQETYTNVLWVDPCCPTTRTVTNKWAPSEHSFVCQSGFATRAKCGLEVISLTGQKCNNDGCTGGLIVAERGGDDIGSPGDSGGPVYTRVGDYNAAINGMVVAAECSIAHPDFCVKVFAEQVHAIEYGLDVTVYTG